MDTVPDIATAIFSNWDTVSQGVTLAAVDLPPDVKGKMPFNIAEFHVDPGSSTILECHAVREVWYVLDGKGRIPWRGADKVIVKGDFLFMESQVPHCVSNEGALAFKALAIWW